MNRLNSGTVTTALVAGASVDMEPPRPPGCWAVPSQRENAEAGHSHGHFSDPQLGLIDPGVVVRASCAIPLRASSWVARGDSTITGVMYDELC
jgi:hypothetical protein